MLGNESKEQTMLCRMCPIVRRQCDANTTPARACFAYLFAQITRRLHWFDHQGLHLVSVYLFLLLFVFSFSIYLIIFTLRTSKDAGEWRQSAAKVGVFWERERKSGRLPDLATNCYSWHRIEGFHCSEMEQHRGNAHPGMQSRSWKEKMYFFRYHHNFKDYIFFIFKFQTKFNSCQSIAWFC